MKDIDAVILCGGLGKRLRSVVADRPKSLAQVNNKPFLDILIEYLASFGFRRFVLCIGYMAEAIRRHYERNFGPLKIVFSQEDEPLGTGGAIKNAQLLIHSDPFLALNGDSFFKLDLWDFYKFHLTKKAIFSIALSKPKNDKNSGVVLLDKNKKVIAFKEKAKPEKESYSNAGIYLMSRKIFQDMQDSRVFSLEYDIFPALIGKGCYGYYGGDEFIDIGTPENLAIAGDFLEKLKITHAG
ncbi:MAG: sugar phosphate nucleotidyltransferase [Candidatus Omnitrophica bacterium]|nr:sugar phosphate nucleotidyltransferase [Candidatus Omnitrophota bacterium]